MALIRKRKSRHIKEYWTSVLDKPGVSVDSDFNEDTLEGTVSVDNLLCDCDSLYPRIDIYINSYNDYLGVIYPYDLDDYRECVNKLLQGENPVKAGWEDGMGNSLSYEGWGEEEE